jgi:hypothetical protein
MSIVLDSIRGLINTKQKEGDLLQVWTKPFRIARDLLELHLSGPRRLQQVYLNWMYLIQYQSENVKRKHLKHFLLIHMMNMQTEQGMAQC